MRCRTIINTSTAITRTITSSGRPARLAPRRFAAAAGRIGVVVGAGVGGAGQPCAGPALSRVARGLSSPHQFCRDTVSLSSQTVSAADDSVYCECAEAVDRDDRGAPPRGARRDPGRHRGAGGRARAGVGDDVADRRGDRHRAGDAVQVLPRRRGDPGRLARTPDRRATSTISPRSATRPATAGERLEAVLEAYALSPTARHHGTELAALLHRGEHVAQAQQQLHGFVRDLMTEAAQDGESGTTSRPTSWPATACTPWPRPAACHPGRGPPARHRHPGRAAPPGLTIQNQGRRGGWADRTRLGSSGHQHSQHRRPTSPAAEGTRQRSALRSGRDTFVSSSCVVTVAASCDRICCCA